MLHFTEENPFLQVMHDAAILANHRKTLETGAVFMHPKLKQVH